MATDPISPPIPVSKKPVYQSTPGSTQEIARTEEAASVSDVRPNLEEAQAQNTADVLARRVSGADDSGLKVVGALDPEKVARLLEDS